MRRITEDLLIRSPLVAAAFYSTSLAGLMLCFYNYNSVGAFLYPLFYALNAWPLTILQQLDGEPQRSLLGIDEEYRNAFARGQWISLAGWLLISPFMLLMFRGFSKILHNKKNKEG